MDHLDYPDCQDQILRKASQDFLVSPVDTVSLEDRDKKELLEFTVVMVLLVLRVCPESRLRVNQVDRDRQDSLVYQDL